MTARVLVLCFAAGCVGGTKTLSDDSGVPTPTYPSDTGSPPTGTGACDDFLAVTTTVSTSCAAGGVPEELIPKLEFVDQTGADCRVCALGPTTVTVTIRNECPVDVSVDACPSPSFAYGSVSSTGSNSITPVGCGAPTVTTAAPLVVPAGGEVVFAEFGWTLMNAGVNRATFTFANGVPSKSIEICAE